MQVSKIPFTSFKSCEAATNYTDAVSLNMLRKCTQ